MLKKLSLLAMLTSAILFANCSDEIKTPPKQEVTEICEIIIVDGVEVLECVPKVTKVKREIEGCVLNGLANLG